MKKYIFSVLTLCLGVLTFAQVGIGTDQPDASAILHLETTDKGFLPPVMNNITDIRTNIASPATGLLVYDLQERCYRQNSGTPTEPNWECVIETVQGQNPNTATLACNGDLLSNSADIVAASILVANMDDGNAHTNNGCSTDASDGQEVRCVTNFGTAIGTPPNLEVSTANDNNGNTPTGPTYSAVDPDANNFGSLSFVAANNNSMFISDANASAGDAFSFLFYFRMNGGGENATIVGAGAFDANGNGDYRSTIGSWQISRGNDNQTTPDDLVFRYRTGSGSIDTVLESITNIQDGQYHLFALSYDGGTSGEVRLFIDGVDVATITPGLNLVSNSIRFGVNRQNGAYADMDLAEVVTGSSATTIEQFDRTQAYFLCKYGLDASVFAGDADFFPVVEELYQQNSQFELRTFRTPVTLDVVDLATDPTGATTTPVTDTEFVYDFLNEQYYTIDVTPTPGLGIARSTATNAIANEALPDSPDTDGTYELDLNVSSGGAVSNLSWEVE